MEELVEGTVPAPLVKALQAFRGVSVVSAVTIAAEAGDLRRFATAGQFTSCVGLVPFSVFRFRRSHRSVSVRSGNPQTVASHGGEEAAPCDKTKPKLNP